MTTCLNSRNPFMLSHEVASQPATPPPVPHCLLLSFSFSQPTSRYSLHRLFPSPREPAFFPLFFFQSFSCALFHFLSHLRTFYFSNSTQNSQTHLHPLSHSFMLLQTHRFPYSLLVFFFSNLQKFCTALTFYNHFPFSFFPPPNLLLITSQTFQHPSIFLLFHMH